MPVGGDQRALNRRTLIAAILGLVVVVALAVWGFVSCGSDNDSQAGSAAETSVPAVDDSGAQEHEMEAAPGEHDGVQSMSMTAGGQTAPVDLVQLTDQGALLPPQDISKLGWYSASAVPGDEGDVGSSVITGHVNFAGQGDGFARRFVDMKVGEEFTVNVNGEDRQFRVTEAPVHVTKGADWPEVVNNTTGENKLVLITCGGEFVGGQLGYADNIVTVAEPVR